MRYEFICKESDLIPLEKLLKTSLDISPIKIELFQRLRKIWLQKALGSKVFFERSPYYKFILDIEAKIIIPNSIQFIPGNYKYRSGESYINFASSYLGGKIFKNGFAQEEFIFSMSNSFPYLAMPDIKLRINQTDGPIIVGMNLISDINNSLYGRGLRNKRTHITKEDVSKFKTAIDIQFISMPAPKFSSSLKSKYDFKRICEMTSRAYSSFCGAYESHLRVYGMKKLFILNTGMWGCGVYHNNPYIVLLVQTLAWSLFNFRYPDNNAKLNYYTADKADMIPTWEQYRSRIEDRTIGQIFGFS